MRRRYRFLLPVPDPIYVARTRDARAELPSDSTRRPLFGDRGHGQVEQAVHRADPSC